MAFFFKILILVLVMCIVQPADCYFDWVMWCYPLLYSISIVSFLFFLDLLISNYAISCLYLGAVTIIIVLINPVMQPELPTALGTSIFIPGFFYVVAARMSATNQLFDKSWLFYGIIVQFMQLFITVSIKYLSTIRNSLSIKREKESNAILKAQNVKAYYNKSSVILENFNLTIPHGSTLCLAGANGCGKSTFTKCLTGY